jgi:hypothetical protein
MEMNADAATVSQYLDQHQGWFRRCASPMQADPIGETGYALGLGKFGALGYDVEPKIGLDLLPHDAGIYRILTIPVPGYEPVGYDVDFQAALQLNQSDLTQSDLNQSNLSPPDTSTGLGASMGPDASVGQAAYTRVEWVLDLGVQIHFPRFIQVLPNHLIKATGDRLLLQIVRQVSRRLTRKVQQDFHTTLNLPLPKGQTQFTKVQKI